jgi:hypothetical protein
MVADRRLVLRLRVDRVYGWGRTQGRTSGPLA